MHYAPAFVSKLHPRKLVGLSELLGAARRCYASPHPPRCPFPFNSTKIELSLLLLTRAAETVTWCHEPSAIIKIKIFFRPNQEENTTAVLLFLSTLIPLSLHSCQSTERVDEYLRPWRWISSIGGSTHRWRPVPVGQPQRPSAH